MGSFFANRTQCQAVEQIDEASSSASVGIVLPKVQLIIASKASKNSPLFGIMGFFGVPNSPCLLQDESKMAKMAKFWCHKWAAE